MMRHFSKSKIQPMPAVALLIAMCLCCQSAHALPIARLKNVRPVVQLRSGRSGAGFMAVRARQALAFGDTIRTGPTGKVDLLFSNGTQVALRSRSTLQIIRPSTSSGPLIIGLVGALSEAFVRPKGNTVVRTVAAIAAARGTEFLVRLPTDDSTQVTVSEGSVDFFNPRGAVLIQVGEQSTATTTTAPTIPRAVDVTGLLEWTADVTGLPLQWETAPGTTLNRNLAAIVARLNQGDVVGARADLDNFPIQSTADAAQSTADAQNAAQSTAAMVLRGWIALQSGELDSAQNFFESASVREPRDHQARAYLALTLLNRGQIEAARREAVRATQLQPRSPLAQSTLSSVLFFNGDIRGARRAAKLAGSGDDLSPFVLLMRGRVALASGDLGTARDDFAQASALAPRLNLLRRELAQADAQLDRVPQAIREYRAALQIDPDDRKAQSGLATVLNRAGETAAARALFESVLQADANDSATRSGLAQLFIDAGDLESATRELERGARDDSQNGAIYIRLSEAALYRQKLSDAMRFAQRAVDLLPDSAPAHYQLGRVYLEQERTVQAESSFRRAVVLDSQFDRARFGLGLVREKTARPLLEAASSLEGPVSLGGVGSGTTLQNLQTPGATERIQGFSADPTIAREATRSYGDNEIGALIGDRSTHDAAISHLRLSNDRRVISGFNFERQNSSGIRPNNDSTLDRGGLTLGRKARNGPSSLWLLGDYENERLGLNSSLEPRASAQVARFDRELRRMIFGFNSERDDQQRTRALLEFDRVDGRNRDPDPSFNSNGEINDRSANFELRHDLRIAQSHRLSGGVSVGSRRRDFTDEISGDFNARSIGRIKVAQQTAYLRDEWRLSRRITVTGEMALHRLVYRGLNQDIVPRDAARIENFKGTAGVPNLIVQFRPDRRSDLRFRARRLYPQIEDFRLLAPSDVFFLSPERELIPDNFGPFNSGRSLELEFNRTLPNASYLAVGVYQRDFDAADAQSKFHLRGLQVAYEGMIGRDTSFWVRTLLSSPQNKADGIATTLAEFPRMTSGIGLQYLNERGVFAQGSYIYQGRRFRDESDGPRGELGGFGVLNLRVGKRQGLRAMVFLELRNALDHRYDIFEELQSVRQLRIGALRRF